MNATNIRWHKSLVTPEDRAKSFGHRPVTLWLTGLSGSGKSTLATRLERVLVARRVATYVIDGDNVRHGLCKDLGFSPESRAENVRRVGEVARLFTDAGLVTITALVSPFRRDRDAVRALFDPGLFAEVWVSTPLEVCEKRDSKGLYAKARRGEVADMTGVTSPYEEPLAPELVINSSEGDPELRVAEVIAFLEKAGYIRAS